MKKKYIIWFSIILTIILCIWYIAENIEEPITKEQIQNEQIIKLSKYAGKDLQIINKQLNNTCNKQDILFIKEQLNIIHKEIIKIKEEYQCQQQLLPQ